MMTMTKNNTKTQGERLSFMDIFRKRKLSIQIPIIQRDYAQGRSQAGEVRTAFLEALSQYLQDDETHELDFVYGAENPTETGFLPLDGQQRLTTLFLLHWYLAQITNDLELRREFYSYLLDEQGHTRFSYETRPSARDFCEALLSKTKEAGSLELNGKPSEIIRDQAWYFLSWDYDPTISAMLVMLDDIARVFERERDGLAKLMDEQNPRIAFYFLDLKRFGLTDDLYIKMNGRGKPLTAFENLKANLEQYLRIEEQDEAFANSFARDMDRTWSDLLWHYRNVDTEDDTADSEYTNLLQVLLGYAYFINSNTEYDSVRAQALLDEDHSFMGYKKLGVVNRENLAFVSRAMHALSNGSKALSVWLPEAYRAYVDEVELFQKMLKNPKPSYSDRLIFFGYLIYLYKHGKPEGQEQLEGFCDWMRLVKNLYLRDNNRIDNIDEYRTALNALYLLAEEAKGIYRYIAQEENKLQGVAQAQFAEERRKARLILENREVWLPRLIEVETHEYFQGQVGFLLAFATQQEGAIDIEKFDRYAALARGIFAGGYDGRRRDGYLLERAVLTKGDYIRPKDERDRRANMLSTNVGGNVYRDNSWRRWLRADDTTKGEKVRQYFKALLDDPRLIVGNDIYQALARIIEEDKDILEGENIAFRKTLITYPELIANAKMGFVGVVYREDGSYTYRFLAKHHLNSLQAELYSYALYVDIQNDPDLEPLKGNGFAYIRTAYAGLPHLYCGSWTRQDATYEVRIECCLQEEDKVCWKLVIQQRTDVQNTIHVYHEASSRDEIIAELKQHLQTLQGLASKA